MNVDQKSDIILILIIEFIKTVARFKKSRTSCNLILLILKHRNSEYVLCLIFIVKSLEYGKYYSRLELTAAKFNDLEEETNSGH